VTREQALPYIGYCVDDALSEHPVTHFPAKATLVGWQCGFEPMFVAVWSYLDVKLDADEAIDIATDLLEEKRWFACYRREPDYVL
jgi:hypothetical protein